MATYQHYSTALKSYYSLGLQDQFVTKSVRDLIPNSTAFGCKNHFNKEIIGKELNANFDKTKSEIQALYAPHAKVMRETTLAFSKFVTLLINSFEQKTFQKTMRAKKTDLINFLEEFSGIISYKTASSWMSISEKTLYSWRHRVKFKCDASPFLACVKRHPNQATLREVQIIKEYLENEKYQHWGIHSIWAVAFKNGITSLSCETWRFYNSFLNFRSKTKKGKKPPNSAPLRADVINEMWHADITVFKTMDGVKHYIYTVMDNYSRYIHSWRIEKVVSAKIRLETITDAIASAFNGVTFQDLHLITDGGPENDNLTLKMFMKANETSIKHPLLYVILFNQTQ